MSFLRSLTPEQLALAVKLDTNELDEVQAAAIQLQPLCFALSDLYLDTGVHTHPITVKERVAIAAQTIVILQYIDMMIDSLGLPGCEKPKGRVM